MGTIDKPQVMVGVKFELLGATFNAGYAPLKNGGRHIFIHEDHSVANEGITIDKIIEDVNKLFGKENMKKDELANMISTKLTPLVKKGSSIKAENITFKLTTVYLDMKIPTAGDRTVEYAFRLDVDATDLIPEEISLIDIDRLTIAVWNTTNQDVIKQLNLEEK